MDWALDLVRLVIVGLAAGLFASYRSNRDFRRQRWWERKADAYTRIIDGLSELVEYYRSHYLREIEGGDFTDEHEKDLEQWWRKSHVEIMKAANAGAFLISGTAEEALKEFRDSKPPTDMGFFLMVEHDFSAAENCLKKLVECSKQDLKVR